MSISADDLRSIASNGGGMILNAEKYSPSDLRSIASNASTKQASVVFKNAKVLNPADMRSIASNGKGRVVFDLFCL